MKKIINAVDQVENQMIEGMVKAFPQYVKKLDCGNVVVRAEKKTGKVALISGGGSGHEPAHGGFVGKGMLDAAVAGAVFTSPTPDQIYEGIKAVDDGKGVLMVVKNYTGDVLNFEMAAEMAADMDGIEVKEVVVNDDVAVQDSLYTTGRRGVAGTVFVHKIAGALAEKMEIGIGIHGEPGVEKKPLETADEIVDTLLEKILADIDYSGSEVAVMINGCGSTPLMELFIVNNRVADVLAEKGIKVYKTMVGEYMTSLEMEGFSITLLRLDDQMKELLDEEADTPALTVAK